MNHTMRRHEREISELESIEILRKGEFGILSMCTQNNEGYGIPLNYVFDNNKIYFHCATEGSKLEFLKNNNKVSFCVVGNTKLLPSKFGTLYESAIAFGTITDVDEVEKREGLMRINEKYSDDFIQEGIKYINSSFSKVHVIKLSIETITGKSRKQ